ERAIRYAPTRMVKALERVLLFDRLNDLYARIKAMNSDCQFIDKALQSLSIKYHISDNDLARIPKDGPTVVIANHPFGAIEGLALASALSSVRTDVKIMANYMLGCISEIENFLILVDPFGKPESAASNIKGLRESIRWVRNGGILVVFPEGQVAHLRLRERVIAEPPWSERVARVIRHTCATAVPVFFQGNNSAMFQLLGLVHPSVRTAMLPRELFNKRGAKIEMRVGNPIQYERLRRFRDDKSILEHLRNRTLLLGHRADS